MCVFSFWAVVCVLASCSDYKVSSPSDADENVSTSDYDETSGHDDDDGSAGSEDDPANPDPEESPDDSGDGESDDGTSGDGDGAEGGAKGDGSAEGGAGGSSGTTDDADDVPGAGTSGDGGTPGGGTIPGDGTSGGADGSADTTDTTTGSDTSDSPGDVDDGTPDDVGEGCTGTIGYWRNHEWDASVVLGDRLYTESELRGILEMSPGGDVSIQLARQLIGVKLAEVYGADVSGIQDAVDAADQWLIDHDDGDGIPLEVSSDSTATDLIDELTDYNDGSDGVDHC